MVHGLLSIKNSKEVTKTMFLVFSLLYSGWWLLSSFLSLQVDPCESDGFCVVMKFSRSILVANPKMISFSEEVFRSVSENKERMDYESSW